MLKGREWQSLSANNIDMLLSFAYMKWAKIYEEEVKSYLVTLCHNGQTQNPGTADSIPIFPFSAAFCYQSHKLNFIERRFFINYFAHHCKKIHGKVILSKEKFILAHI